MHRFVSLRIVLIKEQIFSHSQEKLSQCNSVIVAFLTLKIPLQFPALNPQQLATIEGSLGANLS
jgi:hypothetical protein